MSFQLTLAGLAAQRAARRVNLNERLRTVRGAKRQIPTPWSIGTIVLVAAMLAGLTVFQYWHQLDTWLTTSAPLSSERSAALKTALRGGEVLALREHRGVVPVTSDEISDVGASRCSWRHACVKYQYSRRNIDRCVKVETTYSCAYELSDWDGNTAAAILELEPNEHHVAGNWPSGDDHWLSQRLLVKPLSVSGARTALCELGYCDPGALLPWKDRATRLARERKEAALRVQAERDREERQEKACGGPHAVIVGKGAVCLDLGDAERRAFRECQGKICGPAMVALPKGKYRRGTSPEDAATLLKDYPHARLWLDNERPDREVTIGYFFAIGKFEVTFDDWQACYSDSGCTREPPPSDERWGRGKRPVMNVSWNGITRQYLPWLNAKLGLTGTGAYRLPTDAEWEYAARAGTTARYAVGDRLNLADAQFSDWFPGMATQTAEIGSFHPNAFGLHDMHGNVAEWVQDCAWRSRDHSESPTDGAAAMEEGCSTRAIRGGSWVSDAASVRSASRVWAYADSRSYTLGFRVARTLPKAR